MNSGATRCYFDIETSFEMDITVAGIYYEEGDMVQLVGSEITPERLQQLLLERKVYTYNGSRFDIPVVRKLTGLDIDDIATTHDLMYDCWKNRLFGGLKKVELQLGICRQAEGLDGCDAMRLWADYEQNGNQESLNLLMRYNGDDVRNLELLRMKLNVK